MASAGRGLLQCLLKLFNFILALMGVLMVVYALYMLNEWNKESGGGGDTPSPPPSPDSFNSMLRQYGDFGLMSSLLVSPLLFSVGGLGASLEAPWFIYAFLGVGAFICLVTCTGAIAAEVHSAICLSCYQFGIAFMLLIQVVLAAFLFIDSNWEEDLPDDPSGQLDNLKEFIRENIDIIKWFALAVLVVQIIAVALAMILRALHGGEQEHEEDPENPYTGNSRQPLIPPEGERVFAVVTPAENLGDDPPEDQHQQPQKKKGNCTIM